MNLYLVFKFAFWVDWGFSQGVLKNYCWVCLWTCFQRKDIASWRTHTLSTLGNPSAILWSTTNHLGTQREQKDSSLSLSWRWDAWVVSCSSTIEVQDFFFLSLHYKTLTITFPHHLGPCYTTDLSGTELHSIGLFKSNFFIVTWAHFLLNLPCLSIYLSIHPLHIGYPSFLLVLSLWRALN